MALAPQAADLNQLTTIFQCNCVMNITNIWGVQLITQSFIHLHIIHLINIYCVPITCKVPEIYGQIRLNPWSQGAYSRHNST